MGGGWRTAVGNGWARSAGVILERPNPRRRSGPGAGGLPARGRHRPAMVTRHPSVPPSVSGRAPPSSQAAPLPPGVQPQAVAPRSCLQQGHASRGLRAPKWTRIPAGYCARGPSFREARAPETTARKGFRDPDGPAAGICQECPGFGHSPAFQDCEVSPPVGAKGPVRPGCIGSVGDFRPLRTSTSVAWSQPSGERRGWRGQAPRICVLSPGLRFR